MKENSKVEVKRLNQIHLNNNKNNNNNSQLKYNHKLQNLVSHHNYQISKYNHKLYLLPKKNQLYEERN